MIISPTSLVLRSRSGESMTKASASFTICSSLPMEMGRFSQARRRPLRTFWRSNFSRRPSFLMTMYGISSIRSYVVKRFSHFRHSRRRRIESASLLSRESTTLSFSNPQKGHFIWRLVALGNTSNCSRGHETPHRDRLNTLRLCFLGSFRLRRCLRDFAQGEPFPVRQKESQGNNRNERHKPQHDAAACRQLFR